MFPFPETTVNIHWILNLSFAYITTVIPNSEVQGIISNFLMLTQRLREVTQLSVGKLRFDSTTTSCDSKQYSAGVRRVSFLRVLSSNLGAHWIDHKGTRCPLEWPRMRRQIEAGTQMVGPSEGQNRVELGGYDFLWQFYLWPVVL